ncbi:tumor necrosis factor receptor superfamily member 14 [Oryctolagus cuniculus]|uniref:tumor necrosis factor receptor superfamily member 14 n=1 Tax=Oryctolagus cuniculus TaxID=9986 RepID=UPI0038796488
MAPSPLEKSGPLGLECPLPSEFLGLSQRSGHFWCSPWLMTEAEPGTSSTDATCSPWRRHLVGGLAAAFVLVVPVILGAVVWKRRRRKRPISDQMMVPVSVQGRGPSAGAKTEETEALQAPPSVTTAAAEETAPALA